MTKAYYFERAGIVSMISYSSIFFAVFWGILIWQEYLDVSSIIGGSFHGTRLVLILSGALLLLQLTLADEGMYPISEIHKLNLKAKGLKIDPKGIYNPNGISLIQAVAQVLAEASEPMSISQIVEGVSSLATRARLLRST
jgi:hypothetical protein